MVRLYLGMFAATACLAGLALALSSSTAWVYQEDGLLELSSALLFALAAVVAAARLPGAAGPQVDRQFKWYLGIVLGLGTLAFLDEISFGQSIFGFTSPEILGKKIDGVHDLIVVVQRLIRLTLGLSRTETVFVLAGAGVLTCTMVLFFRGRELHALLHRCLGRDYWITIIVTVLFVLPALLIDASGLTERPEVGAAFAFVEELLELNAGMALLHGVATTGPQHGKQAAGSGVSHAQSTGRGDRPG